MVELIDMTRDPRDAERADERLHVIYVTGSGLTSHEWRTAGQSNL